MYGDDFILVLCHLFKNCIIKFMLLFIFLHFGPTLLIRCSDHLY